MKHALIVLWLVWCDVIIAITFASMFLGDRQKFKEIEEPLDWAWIITAWGFVGIESYYRHWLWLILWSLILISTARSIDRRRVKK